MEAVLTDGDLLGHIFWQIKDPDPRVAARRLLRWSAINQVAHTACTDNDKWGVWFALLCHGYKEWMNINANALGLAFAKAGLHPLVYVKALSRMERRERYRCIGPGHSSARQRFIQDQALLYFAIPVESMRARNVDKTVLCAMLPTTFYDWAKTEWETLEPWKRAMYEASRLVAVARARR